MTVFKYYRIIVHIRKKRGSLYLLPVPLLEAFALPISVERATQKPTPICKSVVRHYCW